VAGQYAQACVQAAGQSGVDVLDLWTLMQKDGQVTHMLAHTVINEHVLYKYNEYTANACVSPLRISQCTFQMDCIFLIKETSLWQSIYGHFLRGEWLTCPSFCLTGGMWTQNALRAVYCVIKPQVI